MSALLTSLFAVTLLLEPPSSDRTVGVSPTGAGSSVSPTGAGQSVTSARITSRTSDFDRTEGVVMFEGDVCAR